MKLHVTLRARREIDRIDAWWRKNRPAAPSLFIEDTIRAIEQALATPLLGKRYRGSKRADVLYVMMPRTQRNLYYVVEGDAVVVLAAWGARRRRGPRV